MKQTLIALCFLFSASAHAQKFDTGNDLLQSLNSGFPGDALTTMWVSGVLAGITMAGGFKCQGKVTIQQSGDIVKRYLIQNPQIRHEQSPLLIIMAAVDANICQPTEEALRSLRRQ